MSIPNTARKRTPSPNWHELVQPGPKGAPAKKQARAERRHRGEIVKQEGDGFNRATRREAGARGWNPGRLVQHPGRLRPADGGPRLDVQSRRLVRAGRRGAWDMVSLATLMQHSPVRGGIDRTVSTPAAVANQQARIARKAARAAA